MTSKNAMLFAAEPRRHAMKDLVIVALTAGLTFGFIVHALDPAPGSTSRAAVPAILAQR